MATCAVPRAAEPPGDATACSIRATSLSTRPDCGSAVCRGFSRYLYARRAAPALSARRRWTHSTACSPTRSASSPSTARASISRRRVPTRSTPSSTAIWRRAASAGPAWGHSRSPASRTPWAGARSAASPTCSLPTWRSIVLRTATACSASGARRRLREARAQGSRHVPRGGRRPHQGAVDHGDQPGRVDARSRERQGRHRGLSVRRRVGCNGGDRYCTTRSCASACARVG